VVVASHERPARLVTLLDALAAQTLPHERWELIVVHTYERDEARRLLDDHVLGRGGLLRHQRVDRASASPALQRNRGWRDARAPLVAFTDDDCRPREDWLERLVGAAREAPGSIVQGATRTDPREHENLKATHVRTLEVDPPGRFTQTCNVLYERDLLERVGGFDEAAITGEDIDLAHRARGAGARLVGEPEALVYHAVEALSLGQKLRSNAKWEHLAYVVKRHPELREECHWGVWWKTEHMYAALALAGLLAAPRRPWVAPLAGLPFYCFMRPRFGDGPRAYVRTARRMPELWLVELAEIGVFLKGSARYRTLLL
jgi:cellulose synthase/poly-beta-1,6-N-acetylglucosamine synthase-like glycosyltransferase